MHSTVHAYMCYSINNVFFFENGHVFHSPKIDNRQRGSVLVEVSAVFGRLVALVAR